MLLEHFAADRVAELHRQADQGRARAGAGRGPSHAGD